ncbi:MAG TPA: T9SS type A sorting domain-containing protein [Saprospiraceae bacterium]|nr:T9SS type A sorting domain-containing protein [Saprospiraceae bacterium]
MTRFLKKSVCYGIYTMCMFSFSISFAEGTKQLSPIVGSGDTSIVMMHTNADSTGNFAEYDGSVVSRLNIRIKDFNTDTLYIGLSREYDDFGNPDGIGGIGTYCFRIIDPDGNVVHGPFSINSGNANADSWLLASSGPDVLDPIDGYDTGTEPYAMFLPAMNGDFYIEFTDNPTNCSVANPGNQVNLKYFDFTVVSGGAEQPGRLWSLNWAFVSPPINPNMPPECQFDRPFNGILFSYTTDGFVSKIDFDSSGFQGLQFTVAFGERGPSNLGNVLLDRMSVNNADSTSSAADHMVFINEPDTMEFPSSTDICGEVALIGVQCVADTFCFNVGITQPGQIEIILDFTGDGVFTEDTTDVILAVILDMADTVCLGWNGLKGDGSPLSFGESIPTIIRYSQGVQHYAAYDVELLKFGFCVETVRPICPGIATDLLYWDDSNISDDVNTPLYDESDPGTGQPAMQLNGCECQNSGCRTWTNVHIDADTSCVGQITGYGDQNTLNTWWFASTTIIGPLDLPFVSVEIVGDSTICFGDSTEFTAIGNPDTIDYVYEWEGPNGFSVNTQSTGLVADAGVYFVTITDTIANCSAVDSITLTVFDLPETSITFTCTGPNQQNADVDLTVTGNDPFTFIWSNGAMTEDLFNVPPDTYIVTITDSIGCQVIDSVTVEGCCELMVECPPADGGQFACPDEIPAPDTTIITVNDYCEPLSISSGDVSNGASGCIGDTLIIQRTYTITDGAGGLVMCIQNFSVVDDVPPSITCPADITVDCDADTDPILTGIPVVSDNCTAEGDLVVTYVDSGAPGACTDDPPVLRTWIVTDGCGNVASCIQSITVQDTVAPELVPNTCPSDTTIECDVVVMLLSPDYTDNCTSTGEIVVSFVDDSLGFDGSCMNGIFGAIVRTYYAEDLCGNIDSSCIVTVSVQDTTAPELISCPPDTTIQCAAPADTLGLPEYADLCSAVTITFEDDTIGFMPPTLGMIIRTFYGTDACGNVDSSCVQTITIQDTIPPTCLTQDITVALDANGFASISNDAVDNGSNDACGVESVTVTPTDFDCADVGVVIVTQTVTDFNGNTSTCTASVTVEDNIAPECLTQDITVQLDAGGNASISDDAVDNGSNDACGVGSITVSPTDFTCADAGIVIVTQTVTDVNGNTSTCTASVTVEDTLAPECITQDITVQLDATGVASISDDGADGGSSDNCGVASVTLSQTDFDCTDVGVVVVTQTVTDDSGNTSTCTASVTVEDNIAPECLTQDITVQLDATGNASIGDDAVDNGSNDACGVASLALSQTSFNCADVGIVVVTQTVTDVNGNTSTCTASVTVEDTIAPECLTQDITIQLDVTGTASISDDALDNGSNDACGIASITLSQTDFTCDDVGVVIVTQTVTDNNTNTSTCTASVTVEDNVAPECLTQDITVQLDANGEATIADDAVDDGSNDACGIASITLSQTTFDCEDLGVVIVTQTVTDNNGNTSTCTAAVTVEDNIAPSIQCPANVTVSCASQVPAVNTADVVTSDNCGGAITVMHVSDVITNQTCANRFTLTRTYQATDEQGNTAVCMQIITVNDVTPPTIECPADFTTMDPNGFSPDLAGTPTVSDNCAGTVTTDFDDVIIPGECPEQFSVERTWTATDVCGNTATCLQIITVDNDCGCDLTCPPDMTINLDPGACEVVVSFPDPTFEGGGCPEDILVPVNLTQNSNSTLIQDALACTGVGDSHWRAYDLVAMGITDDFIMNSLGMASWSAGSVQVFVYSYTGALGGPTLDLGQMTLIGQSNPQVVGAFALSTIPLTAPLMIPAGSTICVEQRITAGGPWCVAGNYAGNSSPAYIQAAPCGAVSPTDYNVFGFGFIHPIQVLNGAILQVGAILVQISGLPSGSAFPIGTTTNCFQLIDGQTGEVVDSCCFDIVVNEHPFSIPPACNDLVHISVDDNCEARICADVILEGGPYGCYDDYIVTVDEYGPDVNVNCISLPYGLGLHTVTITDPETGISCWGTFLIEDKLPPQLTCQDYTLTCGQDLDPVFTPPIQGVSTCSQFPGLPIGPNAGVITTSTCNVSLPQGVEIVDVNVCVKITHTWIGDCDTEIISPSGASTLLWGFGQCGPTDNMHQKFDDAGPLTVLCADINDGCDFILQPVAFQLGTPPLAQYNSTNPNGTWTLMITDNAGGDAGTLDEWHLEIEYMQNAPFAPIASDNCGDVTLAYSDEESGELCDSITILRTWTATDASGHTAQCVQTLTIEPLTLAALECPENYIGTCGQSAHPSVTGWPTIDGVPITEGGVCNIFVGYWDHELADCGNGTKIIRSWTILDWCTQEIEECQQIIKLTDDQAPVLTCPEDQTVGTNPWFCNADVNLLIPEAFDLCGTPFTLTPSVSAGVLIHFGGYFYRVDDLPLGTHTVTWTAEDACGNESSCSYEITVVDDVPPVPICDEHTVVALTTDDPLNEGLTKIYATTFDDGSHDNCGPVTFLARRMDSCIDFDWIGPNGEYPNNDGGLPESIDRGLTFQEWVPFACCDAGQTIMVELRVTDLYGNINSCMVEVLVQDKLPPFIICPPDIVVSCEFWFDGHETNGFEPTDGLESVFGRVLDAYDFDESDREYVIIDDPGNDELPQPYHWGLDGWADDNCNVNIDIRTRLFDDCSGNDLPGGAPDNAVRLVERTFRAQDQQGNTSTCRQRIWVVDFDPFYITDQVCGLNNADDVRWPCDLVLTDCPEGELTPENLSAYAPNNRPIVNDDNCSIIGVTYEDQIFYFIDGACFKIVRTWTVIDWCQFESDGEGGFYGYWQYVQVIKVNDHTGAQFTDCPSGPVTLCVEDEGVTLPTNNQVFLGEEDPNSSACSVHVLTTHTVYEACSDEVIYDVKFYPFNGSEFVQVVAPTHTSVDSNNEAVLIFNTQQNSLPSNHPIRRYGLPYNDRFCSNYPFPGGTKDYHRILWSVEDGCGNLSTCSYLLRLEDCKQPTPICVGLSSVVMPSSGSVTIWAADFDSGSSVDDCTAHEDLLFSFSGDTYQPGFVFDCDLIEQNGSATFILEIWAADEGNDQNCDGVISWEERNKDFCTTFIVIDDNEMVCDSGVGVAGVIETEDVEAVELVQVNMMDQSGQIMSTYITDKNGEYHFVNPLLDYTVEPKRNDNHKNGVSTLDLVEIQKHLLGIKPLASPYKMIAADANNSESVSALDLVEIRKLILGLYIEFPKNTSWRFADADFEFDDPASPWPFAETIELQSGMTLQEDFIGIKVGDINGTVVANAGQIVTRGARQVLKLWVEDRTVKEGELVEIPVHGQNFIDILGFQFTMESAGLKYTGVHTGSLEVPADFIAAHNGAITMSWTNLAGFAEPASVDSDEALFSLVFQVSHTGILSDMLKITSEITDAEAYVQATSVSDNVELLDVQLNFVIPSERERVEEYALYQNEPNPFADQTVIGFDLPAVMFATLTVYDIHGRVVRIIDGNYAQGFNTIALKGRDLKTAGAYYYRLNAGDFTASKKLILSKE